MRMSSPVKVAVLGVGSLGKEHARMYAAMASAKEVTFTGVYDVSAEATQKFAEKYHVRAFNSVEEAASVADALSIVTPTVTHFDLAKALLLKGKHVLVEKPMT